MFLYLDIHIQFYIQLKLLKSILYNIYIIYIIMNNKNNVDTYKSP